MAAKTSNVLARVEPDIKEQAEAVLAQLGVPVSTVINMLYRQIILTQSIPFRLALPTVPTARDEMSKAEFDEMMEAGLAQAQAGQGVTLDACFRHLRGSA